MLIILITMTMITMMMMMMTMMMMMMMVVVIKEKKYQLRRYHTSECTNVSSVVCGAVGHNCHFQRISDDWDYNA